MLVRTDGTVQRRLSRPGQPGSFSAAIRSGSGPLLVEDYWALDPATYPVYDFVRSQGRRSAVCAPIDVGSRRIGCLHVDHRQPGFFMPADLQVAAALAALAAGVIERARQIDPAGAGHHDP